MKVVKFTLPLPPPLNATYRFGSKIMYKSVRAKTWENEAYWLVKSTNKKLDSGQCHATINLYLKRDRDIDSSQKLVFDLLQKTGVIENDKDISSMTVTKSKDLKNPRLEITLKNE